MPQKFCTTTYSFAELLRLAEKDKHFHNAADIARQEMNQWQTSDCSNWWENVYELWKAMLKSIGFQSPDIRFSGFWSQGDGASFTANVDTEKLITFMLSKVTPADKVGVDKSGNEIYGPYLVDKIGGKPKIDPRYKRLLSDDVLNAISIKIIRSNAMRYVHERMCSVEINSDGLNHNGNLTREEETKIDGLITNLETDIETLRLNISQAIYKMLEAEYDSLTTDEAYTETAEGNDIRFLSTGKINQLPAHTQ